MNGWACWFLLALGADVNAILPAGDVCDAKFQATLKTLGEIQTAHKIAGGYALEYRIRGLKLHLDFWGLAARFKLDTLDVDERMYHARELRRMMGWTQ